MKIHVVSDLHLERGYQELPGGEVLVLAGDIAEARDIQQCFHSTRLLDGDIPPGAYRFQDFFKIECAKYERVFYVMGNHEHYRHRLDRTADLIRSYLPSNVRLMDDDAEIYRGVLFLGGTLWTDVNKGNPIDIHAVKFGMIGDQSIKYHNPATDVYHKLTPEVTMKLHKNTLDYFRFMLNEKPDIPAVVITHHAPSTMSIDERYQYDALNAAYVSDLSDFILDHPNIRYWFHGHTHSHKDYTIGGTRVICNPRGYIGFDSNYSGFNPNLCVEI